MSAVVGIDVGGTRLRALAVTDSGEELWSATEPVDRSPSLAPGAFAQLVELARRAVAGARQPVVAVGVGSAGPLDVATGSIANPYTLPPALNGPVVAVLERELGVPVALTNDAQATALGEAWLGAGRGAEIVVAVTLGTGIGVGVVRHGAPAAGAGGWHPEAGHHLLDPNGPECYCGGRGCWEQLSSGTAIGRAMDRRRGGSHTGADVAAAARAGDEDARAVLRDAGRWLGLGLVNVAAFHAPDVIVLAGGVAEAAPADMMDAAREVMRRHGPLHATDRLPVRVAELGNLAGAYGAAQAALRLAGESTLGAPGGPRTGIRPSAG